MEVRMMVAMFGMTLGTALLILGRGRSSAKEVRLVGAFLLLAGFCYLLGIQAPKLW